MIVGVNKYVDEGKGSPIPILKIEHTTEKLQVEKVKAFKSKRDMVAVKAHHEKLRQACQSEVNLMPILIDAVDAGVTVGEVSDIYREVFGVYTDPGLI